MSDSAGGHGTPDVLFTSVPVDLFRLGNGSGPRLDNIRDRDVDIVDERFGDGEVKRMVHPRGGLSTFDAVNPSLTGKWWRIPAGTPLPATIRVVRDRKDPRTGITHYSLRPAYYMPLLVFAQGLAELARAAVLVTAPPAASAAAAAAMPPPNTRRGQ